MVALFGLMSITCEVKLQLTMLVISYDISETNNVSH